ncbi:MAG: hypothetical protein R3E77_01575 [Steroidobacteraceae bacterium]
MRPILLLGAITLGHLAYAADAVLPSITSRMSREDYARPASVPDDAALVAAGARIGKVTVRALNIFDTKRPEENTKLFRLANRLHIRTRDHTVAVQLLFDEGELYDPRRLEESERILRTTRYLQNAYIRPIAYHDNRVDIEVITRDVWTLNPGLSYGRKGGKNTGGIEIEELNLLGYGSQLSFGYKSGLDRDSRYVQFADRQLFGSWWGVRTQFADNSDGKRQDFAIDHPFYALDSRWGLGITAVKDERVDSIYDLGKVSYSFQTDNRAAGIWAGWSAGLRDGWTQRWRVGYDYQRDRFATDPGSLVQPAALPADRTLSYPWIGWELVQDEYRTDRNRDLIERTEDLALGWHAVARLGYSATGLGATDNAMIFDASLARGFDLDERQLLLSNFSLDGRLHSGEIRDGVASASARYYFRQTPRRLLYVGLGVDYTRNLDVDHQLLLGGDNGLRGYPLRYQAGEGRWLFTIEQRMFSNWFPFRLFNVGGAIFYDMGESIGDNPLGSAPQGLLRDIGFGLRFGNNRSALGNVLHVDFAFPLDGDSSIDKLQIVIETKRSF